MNVRLENVQVERGSSNVSISEYNLEIMPGSSNFYGAAIERESEDNNHF